MKASRNVEVKGLRIIERYIEIVKQFLLYLCVCASGLLIYELLEIVKSLLMEGEMLTCEFNNAEHYLSGFL